MTRWRLLSGRGGRFLVAGGLVGLAFELLAGGDRLQAQRVYRWTDERGVVHFSDSPPPEGAGNVELKNLPREPVAPSAAGEAPSSDAPSPAEPAVAATAPTPKRRGEARVELVDQDQVHAGDAVYEFSGKVENAGGTTAEDVLVVITVTESNQGARCVTEEVEVDPPTLKPGETGTYSISLENPCFHGPINTEVRPDWQ